MHCFLRETICVPEAPALPGLFFCGLAGESDYPKMLAVNQGSQIVDGIQRSETLAEITDKYCHLTNKTR